MANSKVDLPQPDSPTTARNSRSDSSKLTLSTALAVPCRTGVVHAEVFDLQDDSCPSPAPLPHRAQGRVAHLVEGIVQQGESGAQHGNARPRA